MEKSVIKKYEELLYYHYVDIYTIIKKTKQFRTKINTLTEVEINQLYSEEEKRIKSEYNENKMLIYTYALVGVILQMCLIFICLHAESLYRVIFVDKYIYMNYVDWHRDLKIGLFFILLPIAIFLSRRMRIVYMSVIILIIHTLLLAFIEKIIYGIDTIIKVSEQNIEIFYAPIVYVVLIIAIGCVVGRRIIKKKMQK